MTNKTCSCALGFDPKSMRRFPHGECRCTQCNQVYVPQGYRAERVVLYPDFAGRPDPLGTPSPDELNDWFNLPDGE